MKRILLVLALLASVPFILRAHNERVLINNDWKFSLGYAGDMAKDFMHGTEYFTYITKAKSNRENKGPAWEGFDDASWQGVNLPHDWVVDLPFSGDASHSHGYKCIGWKYPENSVGWYRKRLDVPETDKGKTILVEFEGIFRDSQIFLNGFYLGGENSGYQSAVYDLTDYINYGGENVLTVRVDASLEEGWFYEGAGIYRNVYLRKTGDTCIKPYSVAVTSDVDVAAKTATVHFAAEAVHGGVITSEGLTWTALIKDASGSVIATSANADPESIDIRLANIGLWSLDSPNLYSIDLVLRKNGEVMDTYSCNYGFRTVEFSPTQGCLINGEKVLLKGCDLHLDFAGVGAAVPDELWRYRLLSLREYGFNAIRCSHNPATPSMLDLCDELGFAVIDENREFGVNERQFSQLRRMIERDRNHPSVFLWSIGNEEWALEWDERIVAIAEKLTAVAHDTDPTRNTTYGNCSGPYAYRGVDTPGYNYIAQNKIPEEHAADPTKTAVGTEETSGCGTRGKYDTVPEEGWMRPINRTDAPGVLNVIERGWRFYHENEWTGGLFYWTGTDYRGEANPMVWPATGSQFGILDYCSFPKDEAFYLKSWWTDEPVLHICGEVDGQVWVYSNCAKVELFRNGKSLGKQAMPVDGHLVWSVPVGKSAVYTAKGYNAKGKKVLADQYPAAVPQLEVTASKTAMKADGQDVIAFEIDSCEEVLDVTVDNATFLGWGNGNPGYKEVERPVGKAFDTKTTSSTLAVKPFCGKALVIIRSIESASGDVTVSIAANGKELKSVICKY